ncbi:hypothetical protein O3P69_002197 [Scylla paramamosain]|uniref:Uncharacterized protein n=1 Tax=Scylla paramamosain TaxID=85552 RepID=A0AAW0V770_SCYPA
MPACERSGAGRCLPLFWPDGVWRSKLTGPGGSQRGQARAPPARLAGITSVEQCACTRPSRHACSSHVTAASPTHMAPEP